MPLTDAHLRAISEGLDLLVMPSPEEVRAVVAELREKRHQLEAATTALNTLGIAAGRAERILHEAIKEAGK